MQRPINVEDLPEATIMAKEADLFEDALLSDGCLEAWRCGQFSDMDLLDRLKYFRQQAELNAATQAVDEANQGWEHA